MCISNNDLYPQIAFRSTDASKDNGLIYLADGGSNGMSYNCIGFRTNSYNSSTGENNGFYEDYRTPYVDADRMTNVIHQLLTTKSPVTIA